MRLFTGQIQFPSPDQYCVKAVKAKINDEVDSDCDLSERERERETERQRESTETVGCTARHLTDDIPADSSSCDTVKDFSEYLTSTKWLPSTALMRLLVQRRRTVDRNCKSEAASAAAAPSPAAVDSTPDRRTADAADIEYD